MAYKATILADSMNQVGDRLTTFEICFPRFLLPEYATHRDQSKNGASSRAIPVQKFIDAVTVDPVVPIRWGKNRNGMVSGDNLSDSEVLAADYIWLQARDDAVRATNALVALGVHKTLPNRLLENWSWQTMIVSATRWGNFFALRSAPDVEDHLRHLVFMMIDQYYFKSVPVYRDDDQWHLPLVDESERPHHDNMTLAKISAARCAAVTHLRQHDIRSVEDWMGLCDDKLIAFGHWSPLEHPAVPAWHPRHGGNSWGNYVGWRQLRKFSPNEVRDFTIEDARMVLGR